MSKFYKLPMDIAERKDLLPSDKLVYVVVADCFNGKAICWPGKRYLVRRTGLSGQAVLDAINRLEKAGLLVVERRGNGRSNHYKKSGQEIRPVKELDRSKNDTTGGLKIRPEAVKELDPNQTDQLNQKGIFPFSVADADVEPTPDATTPEPHDPDKIKRVLESLGL